MKSRFVILLRHGKHEEDAIQYQKTFLSLHLMKMFLVESN